MKDAWRRSARVRGNSGVPHVTLCLGDNLDGLHVSRELVPGAVHLARLAPPDHRLKCVTAYDGPDVLVGTHGRRAETSVHNHRVVPVHRR